MNDLDEIARLKEMRRHEQALNTLGEIAGYLVLALVFLLILGLFKEVFNL